MKTLPLNRGFAETHATVNQSATPNTAEHQSQASKYNYHGRKDSN